MYFEINDKTCCRLAHNRQGGTLSDSSALFLILISPFRSIYATHTNPFYSAALRRSNEIPT